MLGKITVDSNIKIAFDEEVVDGLDILIFTRVCCTHDGDNSNGVLVNQVHALFGINDPSLLRAVDVLNHVSNLP